MSATTTSMHVGGIANQQQGNNVQKQIGLVSPITCNNKTILPSVQCNNVMQNQILPGYQSVYQFPNNQAVLQPIGTLIPAHFTYGGSNIIQNGQQPWNFPNYPIVNSKESMSTISFMPVVNEIQTNGNPSSNDNVFLISNYVEPSSGPMILPKNATGINRNKPHPPTLLPNMSTSMSNGNSTPLINTSMSNRTPCATNKLFSNSEVKNVKPTYSTNFNARKVFPRKVGRPRKHYPPNLLQPQVSTSTISSTSTVIVSSQESVKESPNSSQSVTEVVTPIITSTTLSSLPVDSRTSASPKSTEVSCSEEIPKLGCKSKESSTPDGPSQDFMFEPKSTNLESPSSNKKILTHNIENFVIHEFDEPFLVSRAISGKISPLLVEPTISNEDSSEPPLTPKKSPTKVDDQKQTEETSPSLLDDNIIKINAFENTDPSSWSIDQVHQFVASTHGCHMYADNFKTQKIDGQALLLLNENHLMTQLDFKLGPALKMLARINQLKET